MKVVAHLDPVVLEGELLRRIEQVKEREGKTAPVLVVVPTARLVGHVQRRLAEKFGAVLGVEIVHFHGLAGRIHEASASDYPDPASSRVLTELLRRCIGELPDGNRLKSFVRQRPGAATSLMSSIRDLREAGVTPGDFSRVAHSSNDFARLYAVYCTRIGKLQENGLTDEAGYIQAATESVTRQPGAAFLYGAYELIGVHLDLLRKLEPVTALLPFDPTGNSPAGAYAERFACRFLLDEGQEPETVDATERTSLAGERLGSLYDENSRPEPLPENSIILDDFQGGSQEALWAVRRALASGTDPREIGILARDLDRYGPALETALERLPWTSSLQVPLRREPVVHDALVLLQVVVEDFPRAPTVELLSSPRIDWEQLGGQEPDGAAADVWSRKGGILSGLENWKRALPREASFVPTWHLETDEEKEAAACQAESNGAEATRIIDILSLLQERYRNAGDNSWKGLASRFRSLLEPLPEQPQLEGILEEMERLDRLQPGGEPSPREALSWLVQAVDDTRHRPLERDNGSIRVLDSRQARGLTFKQVFLLGFHGGSFPRTGREDPFLNDRTRSMLEQELGVPLPAKAGDGGEEHLLLAVTLGAAAERLHVSWQRADEAGRAVSPSPALRELARIVRGTPDVSGLLDQQVKHRPVHPRGRMEKLAEVTSMLDPVEGTTLAAFSLGGRIPDAREATPLHLPARTVRMLQATERFRFGPAEYDGRIEVDGTDRSHPWPVTALEELGRCPLRFFFKRILKVRELEDEQSPLEVAPRDIGTAVHAVLEKVYGALQDEGMFEGGDPDVRVQHGRELLEQCWDDAFRQVRHQAAPGTEPLLGLVEQHWKAATWVFLEGDLQELSGSIPLRMEMETYRRKTLTLDDRISLKLGGKFDRIVATDPPVICDYKTSGALRKRVSISEMLKGNELQAVLYRLLEGNNSAHVEMAGVGPSFVELDPGDARPRFEGFRRQDQEAGMSETLQVLASLIATGCYPLREESKSCSYCEYKAACRLHHPPTLAREQDAGDGRDYQDLAGKNFYAGKTILAQLRTGRENR